MTSENTYEDKKQEESVTSEVTRAERPFSTLTEYDQRWKQLAEESGILWMGTAEQAREQRLKNGEPPASNDLRDFSAIIGGGPPRRS